MLYGQVGSPQKLNASMESWGEKKKERKKKIYRPNFFRPTKLRARSPLSGVQSSSTLRGERKKIQYQQLLM